MRLTAMRLQNQLNYKQENNRMYRIDKCKSLSWMQLLQSNVQQWCNTKMTCFFSKVHCCYHTYIKVHQIIIFSQYKVMPVSQDRGLVRDIYLPHGFGDKCDGVSGACAQRHCSQKVDKSVSTSLNKVFWGVMRMYY